MSLVAVARFGVMSPWSFRWGRNGYSQGELKAAPIFVWYDYFSCPQPMADQMSKVKSIVFNPLEDLRRAIASIPAYVASCHFFVALCPMLQTDGIELNQYTWARRGWCRAEKMAWELSDRHGLVLMVDSPEHLTLSHFKPRPGMANSVCQVTLKLWGKS